MKKTIMMVIFTLIVSACGHAANENTIVSTDLILKKYDKYTLVHEADVIIRGIVKSKDVQLDSDGLPATDVFIDVTDIYKGTPEKTVEIRVKGGKVDNIVYLPEEDKIPQFREGEDVILFLTSNKGMHPDKDKFGYYVVGQSQGKFEVIDNATLKGNKHIGNDAYHFELDKLAEQIASITKENEINPPIKDYVGEESPI